jgi:hypothetical protein
VDATHDSLDDLEPTLFACSDVHEWIAAGKSTPGHTMIVARQTTENRCRFQKGVEESPVCRSL